MFAVVVLFFFFKQKTAYEMRISDWSSDVCSSDLALLAAPPRDRGLVLNLGRDLNRRILFLGHERASFIVRRRRECYSLPLCASRCKSRLSVPRSASLRGPTSSSSAIRMCPLTDVKNAWPSPGIGRASCRERGCQY